MVDRVTLIGEAGFQVGGVAQLGEHLLCKQGVTGSIPVVSTTDACIASGKAVIADNQHPATAAAIVCSQTMRAAPRLVAYPLYRGMSRIRFDHAAEAKRPGLWVMPFERSPR